MSQNQKIDELRAVIKCADMDEHMQQECVEITADAMDKFNLEKDIAAYVKKSLDEKYEPHWHTVVGKQFGSYVSHETNRFIYFFLEGRGVLIFKSG